MNHQVLTEKLVFDLKYLNTAIQTLQLLRSNVINRNFSPSEDLTTNLGICYNWQRLLITVGMIGDESTDISYETVSAIGAYWPQSCNPGVDDPYPVPVTEDFTTCPMGYKWEGEQLTYRLSLINFILMHLCMIQERRASNG